MYFFLFNKTQIVLNRLRAISDCAVAECVAASGGKCRNKLKTT